MNFKRIIILSASILMFTSLGVSPSQATNYNVHASRTSKISRLRNRMNYDYKRANYYSKQAKMIKNEIQKLNNSHQVIPKKITNKEAYYIGRHRNMFITDEGDFGKYGVIYYRLRHNKSFLKGFYNYMYSQTYNDIIHGRDNYPKENGSRARRKASEDAKETVNDAIWRTTEDVGYSLKHHQYQWNIK